MIIERDICKECGEQPRPEKIQCDQCGREHSFKEFQGAVIHFETPPFDCDDDCDECSRNEDESIMDEDDTTEFHFCNLRCLSEYITDPTKDCFSNYDNLLTSVLVYPGDVSNLLYALGRASYDD
jgi:hypothetical protein